MRPLPWCLILTLAAGCTPDGDGGDPVDMTPADARAADADDPGPDTSAADLGDRDGPLADAMPLDAAARDTSPPDATPDTELDTEPDATPDTEPDAPPDAPPDAAPLDATPDACAPDCGPPRIITFAANRPRLTAGEQIILTAVVTDPDGAADLLGGVLETPDGVPYGPFAAEAGTYSFTLSWDALHAVTPIEFDGTAPRTLVAAFFDQAGNRTTATLDITLHCDGAGAACAGACTTLDTPEHCGACRAACDTICRDRRCVCPDGLTRCDGQCIPTTDDPHNCGACGRACDPLPDSEAACVDSRCRVRCDPGFQLCDPDAPRCAPCPIDGVARVTCDGPACVAAACDPDARLCDGACPACPDDALDDLCLGHRCAATLCREPAHPCADGCCPWRRREAGTGGQTFALAADDDTVHVALGDRERVLYRRWIDDAWVDETPVRLDAPAQSNIELDIATADGTTHLVYTVTTPRPDGTFTGRIGYMQRRDGAWRELGGVDGGDEPYRQPDLAIRGDTVRVAWAGRRIRVADPREDPWRPDLAFDGAESAPRLAIAPDGTEHLVAVELFGDLLYARRPPGGAFEPVDPRHGVLGGEDPRITTDADGHPAIAHLGFDDQPYLTRYDGRAWHTEAALRGFTVTSGHAIFNGADGRLITCLGTPLGLYLLHETAAEPVAREVADGGHFGCTFALAPDGGHHLLAAFGRTIDWLY